MIGKMKDRRIQKTKAALHGALIELMRKKPYESILVKNILDQANVGRSTFYMHYSDKDELLLEGLQHLREYLQAAQAQYRQSETLADAVMGFSLAMFEHAYDHRDVYKNLISGQAWVVVRGHMEEMFARIIEKEAKPLFKSRRPSIMPFGLFLYAMGSVFWSVMTWWLDQQKPLPPARINTMFQSLVTPMLESNLV